jgi:hypothetical protein
LKEDKYVQYVFDLWADGWRRKCARGCVVVVRFADDFVAGFQYREDAERFWGELRERFEKFNLRLQEDKTRLIEFGKFAAENQRRRGGGKIDKLPPIFALTTDSDRSIFKSLFPGVAK